LIISRGARRIPARLVLRGIAGPLVPVIAPVQVAVDVVLAIRLVLPPAIIVGLPAILPLAAMIR
jgi:hypothetical protein